MKTLFEFDFGKMMDKIFNEGQKLISGIHTITKIEGNLYAMESDRMVAFIKFREKTIEVNWDDKWTREKTFYVFKR